MNGSTCPVPGNITYGGFTRDSVSYESLGGVIAFYLVIFAIGVYASWRSKSFSKKVSSEEVMLANRDIGFVVGAFTMTATWVGGGYINGTAENVYTPGAGFAWTQAIWAYGLCLVLGGLFYAKPLREANYVTMLDPITERYGSVITWLCYLVAFIGDITWSGAILAALGASLTVITGLQHTYSVIISSSISILYTLLGGLYSVAFTDLFQLVAIAFGLVLSIPFALQHPAVGSIWDVAQGEDGWVGALKPNDPSVGYWLDGALLLILGGIPWQAYFQRVLAAKTARHAQILSYLAGVATCLMGIPSIFIGAIGKATDWNATGYQENGVIPMPQEDYKLILPLVMHYLTPPAVAVIGLGALAAAVMSSADSSTLACSTMFTRNVYLPARRMIAPSNKPSEREILWVMRVGIIIVGILASSFALFGNSIYGLWVFGLDMAYVILFPALTCALFLPFTNSYGALVGWILGLFFRLGGGEPVLYIPPLIKYPYYDECSSQQLAPFKTIAMLMCFSSTMLVSLLASILFTRNILPKKMDFFKCFPEVLCFNKQGTNGDQSQHANGAVNKSYSNSGFVHNTSDASSMSCTSDYVQYETHI